MRRQGQNHSLSSCIDQSDSSLDELEELKYNHKHHNGFKKEKNRSNLRNNDTCEKSKNGKKKEKNGDQKRTKKKKRQHEKYGAQPKTKSHHQKVHEESKARHKKSASKEDKNSF